MQYVISVIVIMEEEKKIIYMMSSLMELSIRGGAEKDAPMEDIAALEAYAKSFGAYVLRTDAKGSELKWLRKQGEYMDNGNVDISEESDEEELDLEDEEEDDQDDVLQHLLRMMEMEKKKSQQTNVEKLSRKECGEEATDGENCPQTPPLIAEEYSSSSNESTEEDYTVVYKEDGEYLDNDTKGTWRPMGMNDIPIYLNAELTLYRWVIFVALFIILYWCRWCSDIMIIIIY